MVLGPTARMDLDCLLQNREDTASNGSVAVTSKVPNQVESWSVPLYTYNGTNVTLSSLICT